MTRLCCVYVLLLMMSGKVSANNPFPDTSIAKFVIHDNGQAIIIKTATSIAGAEGCPSHYELVLKKSNPLFNEMYSALLAAFHSGTRFGGWVNGCEGGWGIPIITRLDFVK